MGAKDVGQPEEELGPASGDDGLRGRGGDGRSEPFGWLIGFAVGDSDCVEAEDLRPLMMLVSATIGIFG